MGGRKDDDFMKPGLQTAQSPSVEKKRGEASGAERICTTLSLKSLPRF
jgi:hypothetical protein